MELLQAELDSDCRIVLADCTFNSQDFHQKEILSNPVVKQLTVRHEERVPAYGTVPQPPPTVVGLAYDNPAGTVYLNGSTAKDFRLVARTTLEPGVNADAVAQLAELDLERLRLRAWQDLFDSHRDDWDILRSGGIDVWGNVSVARTVNASMYAILIALRADWSYGLSPGGLSRNAYEGEFSVGMR